MQPLRLQMQRDMTLRGLALRTQESYIAAVAALAQFYHRSPDQRAVAEVQTYLLHLLEQRKLSWSDCNQAVCAFRFFYGVSLQRKDFAFDIPHGRTPQRSPVHASNAADDDRCDEVAPIGSDSSVDCGYR